MESKTNCKVMVLGCGLECATTEAKGTVLLHTAEELKNFTKGEEAQMEEIIRGIKDAGRARHTMTISPTRTQLAAVGCFSVRIGRGAAKRLLGR